LRRRSPSCRRRASPNDIIATGFQIYINKSNTAPWTGYVDNIRMGINPPPADADFNNDAAVDGLDLGIWKGAYNVSANGDADQDGYSDGNDFLIWQRQLGPVPPLSSVPEPASWVILTMLTFQLARCRDRFSRR